MSLKQTILTALVTHTETYGAFASHEEANEHFLNEFPRLKTTWSAGNSGYFKFFWNKVFREDIMSDPNHDLSRTIATYLKKVNTKPKINTALALPGQILDDLDGGPTQYSVVPIRTFNTSNVQIDEAMFETFLTNSSFDDIMSDDGGAMAACTVVVVGGPGVGKSTAMFWAASQYKSIHPTAEIAVVSSEMEIEDLLYEARKKPWMNSLDFILTSEYGMELRSALERIFLYGYNIIILDSFADICDKLRDFCGMTTTGAESWLLDLMKKAKGGKNERHKYTLTFAIQQQTKSGSFAGTNKLKHNTTAMLELRKEKNGDRYMVFTKNRRCGKYVGKRLFYFLGQNNHVSFDIERWEREIAEDASDNTELNQQQENIDQATIGQFSELTGDSVQRAQALLQQAEITRDSAGNIVIPTVPNLTDQENPDFLIGTLTVDDIHFDEASNLHVLEVSSDRAITGRTAEEVITKARAERNNITQ